MKLQKQLVHIAVLTALTVALSLLFIFPVPATNGFVTLCEVGIYTAAFLMGPVGGFWVGALSGGMIDLLSGYPQWILFSVLIHGVQGGIAGAIFQKNWRYKNGISLILASLFMVVGYALATAFLYTWPAGIASVFGNILQNVFGGGLTLLLIASLRKINFPLMKEGSK
ncbi:ECF transporter S component [Enterococcus olivae]